MEEVTPIDRDKLTDDLKHRLPRAVVTVETINTDHASWRITVRHELAWVQIFWGPLSGFGVTDMYDRGDDPDPFSAYDHPVDSLAAAINFTVRIVTKRVE